MQDIMTTPTDARYCVVFVLHGGEVITSYHTTRREANHIGCYPRYGQQAGMSWVYDLRRDGRPVAGWAWDRPSCHPKGRWRPVVVR